MSNSWIFFLWIIISINHSIDGSYSYAGCFTQVFHESFFTSSYMEPTLCFRLCDTPIIYLQKTICRCSGGGLMHHDKKPDLDCKIPCTKPVDRQVVTANTCGGQKTYSAYIEENFFIQNGHLLTYQINFFACEFWDATDVYETYTINLSELTVTSLNRMEMCAAACLDQNVTTKSIAFNADNNRCLCIMPWKTNTAFFRTHHITVLNETSCNRYCSNTLGGSTVANKFKCGSMNNSRTWAIYDLNGTCPINFVYIKELKKCMLAYKNFWNSCTLPSKSYVYDGKVTWNVFLKIIERLNLNESLVTIDFGYDVVINTSWKCTSISSIIYSSSSSLQSSYYSYSYDSTTSYILDNGCLRESISRSYFQRYSNRLCITDLINKNSLSDDDEDNSTFITSVDPQTSFCPTSWFDLNGRCYRMSEERKTIRDARNSCISILANESIKIDKAELWSGGDDDDDDMDDEQLNDSPKGDIVQYTTEWQIRLGFFLIDTVPEYGNASSTHLTNLYYEGLSSDTSDVINYQSPVNEFQMINPINTTNSSIKSDSCVLSTRSTIEEEERPVLKSISMNNCSTPRHVLCDTKTLIVRGFEQGCFQKPSILDLPALISNRLTYELCLSVCQELQTNLAIIHIDKCYCLNGSPSKVLNLTADLGKYQRQYCGEFCSGNKHERCGDDDTIIVFHILNSRRTYTDARTPAQPFPDFIYDSCISVNSLNPSTTYQFNMDNLHPRHCLELCTNHQQKYSLINSNKCYCTNIPIKNDEYNTDILSHQDCSQRCSANYFYTCGSKSNSTIYSMYIIQPKCLHGFEIAENDQQCVYNHFSLKKNSLSTAESYCKSIGGVLVKIKDILEIQDVLPESVLHIRLSRIFPLFFHFKSFNDTRYFWVDRTSNTPDNNTISERLLERCSRILDTSDKNCLVIHHEKISKNNISIYHRCIAESNQCSIVSAMPVCVDQHLEKNSTVISSKIDDISTKISIDYSCGDDGDYHFVDDYCYRISFHETSWSDAQAECQRDNAMLFVPNKSITLQIIKTLFLGRSTYTASGFAHVGVSYDNQNRTVIQYNISNENIVQTVPDSNAVYDLCEKTFHERYIALMSSESLTINQQKQLKKQQMGCAYIDLLTYTVPVIRCDEIPCNRTATVICQKLPTIKMDIIQAKRESIKISTSTKPSVTSINDQSTIALSASNSVESTKSIGRDFAPIFFILVVLFALIFLGIISTLYNHRLFRKTNANNNNGTFQTGRRNHNSVYSQLSSENEFDLNENY